MSMTSLRSYFRTRLKSISLKEGPGGFDPDNLPDYSLHKHFHLDAPEQSGIRTLNVGIEFTARQKVLLFFQSKDASTAIDSAISTQEDVLKEVMKNTNRLTQTFKNLSFKGAKIEKVASDNPHTARLTMDFEADVYLDI